MPLRIAYLLPDHGIQMLDSSKGAPIHARATIRAMQKDLHAVSAVCMRKGAATEAAFTAPLAEAKPGGLTRNFTRWLLEPLSRAGKEPPNWALAIFTLLRQFDFLRAASFELKRDRAPELIYARNAWFAFPIFVLAKKFRCPIALEVNAIAWREKEIRKESALRWLAKWIERKNLRAAEIVLPVSDAVAQHAIEAGADPAKILVLPNGVEIEAFTRALQNGAGSAHANGKFVVGLVCSFRPFHGVKRLIEAMAMLQAEAPEIEARILGKGPEFEEAGREIESRGLKKSIRLEGVVPYEKLPARMAEFDVAVAPYEGEQNTYGSPMKVYEYMAARRPIVCAHWGEAARILRHGETALLHRAGDARDLADKILELRSDPPLAARLAQNAAREVETKTWHANVRAFLVALQSRGIILMGSAIPDESDPHIRQLREHQTRAQLWDAHDAGRDAFFFGEPEFVDAESAEADSDRDDAGSRDTAKDDAGLGEVAHSDWKPGAGEIRREDLPIHPVQPRKEKSLRHRIAKSKLSRARFRRRYETLYRSATNPARKGSRATPPQWPRDRPLRVLRIISSASMGGVAKVMNQTLLRLDPARIQTSVLAFGQKDHISARLTEAPGLTFRRVPMELWPPSWDWKSLGNIRRLERAIRAEQADVIHLHEPQFAPMLRIAAAAAGVPIVVHLHSAYSTRRDSVDGFFQEIERDSLRALPLIATSANIADDAWRYMGRGITSAQKTIALVEDGVDDLPLWGPDARNEEWIRQRAAGRKILLMISRFIPLKRIPEFLMAARILMELGEDVFVVLVAYGKKEQMRDARRKFRYLFTPEQGELLYEMATPEDLMRMAWAGVSCSELEGLPMTILEYMAAGVPVVLTDIVAHNQIVEDESTGLMFPVGDLPALVRQLRRIVHDTELRNRLVASAREAVARRSWASAADQTLAIYRSMFAP